MNDDEMKPKRSTLAGARAQDQTWQANGMCAQCAHRKIGGGSNSWWLRWKLEVTAHNERTKQSNNKIPTRKCPMIKYLFILLKYSRLTVDYAKAFVVRWLLLFLFLFFSQLVISRFYVMFECSLESSVVIWNVNKWMVWAHRIQLWTLLDHLSPIKGNDSDNITVAASNLWLRCAWIAFYNWNNRYSIETKWD